MDDDYCGCGEEGQAQAPSPPVFSTLVQQYEAPILVAVVAVHAPVLIALSSRHRRSNNPALRLLLSGMSAVYFPLISYVLSYLPTYISSMLKQQQQQQGELERLFSLRLFLIAPVLSSIVLIQFLKAKADMAALAVAAVTSPVAGDDVDCLKIRPSKDSLIYSFWVAGVVIYSFIPYVSSATTQIHTIQLILKIKSDSMSTLVLLLLVYNIIPLTAALWILGACRMILRFAAFRMAARSWAHGRNAELIEGYMAQLQQSGSSMEVEGVPPLIVTGERNENVEETPQGYRVITPSSAMEPQNDQHYGSLILITLDRVWSCQHLDPFPELKDLCLSFALFKCLRCRFAGRRLAMPEPISGWAFHFVCDGLLVRPHPQGKENCKDERIFQVIADELSFARDFYYSPLPVNSLGALSVALHLLSLLITPLLFFLALMLVGAAVYAPVITSVLAVVLALLNAGTEVWEMAASVRNNWTKISIAGLYVRSHNKPWLHKIFTCLLKRKPSSKDRMMGQMELLSPDCLFSDDDLRRRLWAWAQPYLFFLPSPRKNRYKEVTPEVKASILASLRRSGGELSDGMATVMRRCQALTSHVHVTTTTELLLVWHIATTVFEVGCSSHKASPSSSTPTTTTANNMVVAQRLSRYCAYLVVEAPDLLPDNSAWTKLRYKKVQEGTRELALKSRDAVQHQSSACVYDRLVASFRASKDNEVLPEVLKQGSELGQQLVEEATHKASGQDAVWELLADFWSEMVLYLAPSDNVKPHIEALQRGGELITLLWALLLHAGITTRPPRHVVPEP